MAHEHKITLTPEDLASSGSSGAAAAEAEPQTPPSPEIDPQPDRPDAPEPQPASPSDPEAPVGPSVPAPDPEAPVGPSVPAPDQPGPEIGAQDAHALSAKAEEYLALAQRTRADFENYRKRAAREAAAAQDRGVAKLAKELLPAVDNLDRALEAAEVLSAQAANGTAAPAPGQGDAPDDAALIAGIKLVHADVLAALQRAGIERYEPRGEPFDPQHHEAIAQQPVEGAASGTVVEVYQRGYRLGESVLRPARVIVAQ